MYEKVNPAHPDKIADRIAGAIVDLAYKRERDPLIAVEVLVGHGECNVIIETGTKLELVDIEKAIARIAGKVSTNIKVVPQDEHLKSNQREEIKCGDNGIFKGVPTSKEEHQLADEVRRLYKLYPFDGKFLADGHHFTACQSNIDTNIDSPEFKKQYHHVTLNPLGDWTGGLDVDTGCTNRKLGSDMGRAVTGGGLHGKDLSKADASVNIYAYLKAQETGEEQEFICGIGDEEVDGIPYRDIVEKAREYITTQGGFEKFAEWGLI